MLDKIKAKEYKYPNKVHKVPVQSCFFNHQVMPAPVKRAVHGHNEHDHVDYNPGEHVKSVESCDGKEEIGKVGRSRASVCIEEGIAAPPCALVIQVRPLPCLAAQESKSAQDGPCQPFYHTFFVH